MIDRLCKNPYCGSKALKGDYCFNHKPRSPMKQTSTLKRGKPMRKMGKVGKKWLETRDRWFEAGNKAPYYKCYICGKLLTRSQLTLDHIKSRSRHPELRYVLKNLAPCCWDCNTAKGSLDIEEYLATLDKQKEIEHGRNETWRQSSRRN